MGTSKDCGERTDAPRETASPSTRAWASLAVLPLFLILSIAAGEGFVIAGRCLPVGSYAWWVAVLSDIVSVSLVLFASIGAIAPGTQVTRAGTRNSRLPAVIGVAKGLT
ncbi:MAG TPA: hypothetical protein VMV96_05940 [Acidimicrobiales bacterium]|nr:hypothetical protein [Acidimicrobiales bacterium]